MSIAVYGGCFNPPHLGHRAAARSARETLKPEKLLGWYFGVDEARAAQEYLKQGGSEWKT